MSDDELYRALGRIEGLLESVDEKVSAQNTRLDHHSARLSKLEKWQAWTLGAGAAAGAAVAAVWAVFSQIVHGR